MEQGDDQLARLEVPQTHGLVVTTRHQQASIGRGRHGPDIAIVAETPEAAQGGLDPRWASPVVAWLASSVSAGVTGRVFVASGRNFAVAEGWHRGPSIENPDDDPVVLGEAVKDLVAQARPNANMFGYDES